MPNEGDPPYSQMVLRTLDRIEMSVGELRTRMTQQFDGLDNRFLPRAEFTVWLTAGNANATAVTSEIATLTTRIEEIAEQRRVERRFTVTTLLTALAILIALVSFIVTTWS